MMKLNTRPITFILISIIFLFACSSMGSVAESDATLEQAIEQLENAIDRSQDSGSGLDVREAAALLDYALKRNEIETAGGHLSLGNAYFIGQDLGRAILHYRKGLEIDPSHEQLQQNLSHARSFVDPVVPSANKLTSTRSVIQSWHRVTDSQTMWFAVVSLFGIASALCTIKILGQRNRIPLKLPAGIATLGVLGFGLLACDQWIMDHDQGLVVVMPGTGMFSGPGTGVYTEVYDAPLGTGTEAMVLESDKDWSKIMLENDKIGWVPTNSYVLVN